MSDGIRGIIDDAASKASRQVHKKPTQSFADFASHVRTRIRTDRGAYTFEGAKPLKEIAEVVVKNSTEKCAIRKPTQRYFTTTFGFGMPSWQAERNGRNSLLFYPTNLLARDVAQHRFSPAIGGAALDDIAEPRGKTSGIVYTAPGGKTVYFLGLDTARNAISRPADMCIWDEVDDLDQANMETSRQRLDASDYAHELAFCCGRYPEEGIDALYLAGDRRRWIVRCAACRYEHIPEERFPDNYARTDNGWISICPKCGRPQDFERTGRFVAEAPDVQGRVSFSVSALAFGCTDANRIMREWIEAQGDRRKVAAFRSSKLALPDGGDRQSLSASDVARVLAPCPASGPLKYAGVDVGDWCHIACAGPGFGAAPVGLGEFMRVRGEDLLATLADIDARHGLDGILVDQRPEGSLARAVCREFPGRAWMQSFRRTDQKEDERELAGEVFPTMEFDREAMLESWCDDVKAGRILLPAIWDGVPFVRSEPCDHMLRGSGKEEKTDANGIAMLKFRAGSVRNHWFMASIFATVVARRQIGREVAIREAHVGGRPRDTRELGHSRRIIGELREMAR